MSLWYISPPALFNMYKEYTFMMLLRNENEVRVDDYEDGDGSDDE